MNRQEMWVKYDTEGCDHAALHREWNAQFVNENVLNYVEKSIGLEKIMGSKDRHFNDIPMINWDRLFPGIKNLCGKKLAELNKPFTQMSPSDSVCIAKEAAKQIKERGDYDNKIRNALF